MKTLTRKEEQDHSSRQEVPALKLMAFCHGFMEASRRNTWNRQLMFPDFLLLIDSFSILVSTIRIPAPFSKWQIQCYYYFRLNQAFQTLPIQTSDFTGNLRLSAALALKLPLLQHLTLKQSINYSREESPVPKQCKFKEPEKTTDTRKNMLKWEMLNISQETCEYSSKYLNTVSKEKKNLRRKRNLILIDNILCENFAEYQNGDFPFYHKFISLFHLPHASEQIIDG